MCYYNHHLILYFTSAHRLYGVQIKYYYAWEKDLGIDEGIEDNLKQVIDNLSKQYGDPTVNYRTENAYHVKWNHDNQVIHWYTKIDGHAMISELYIYLPWAYKNAFI